MIEYEHKIQRLFKLGMHFAIIVASKLLKLYMKLNFDSKTLSIYDEKGIDEKNDIYLMHFEVALKPINPT